VAQQRLQLFAAGGSAIEQLVGLTTQLLGELLFGL